MSWLPYFLKLWLTLSHLDSWWLILTHFDVLAKAVTLTIRVLIQNLGSLPSSVQFSSIQSLSCVQFFVTPWTAACQAPLSITSSQSSPKPMSIESVMPSNHLILCRPLLLLPSIFPSIRVFSNESVLCIRWPKYWSFSFNISPSNEHPELTSFRMDWLNLGSLSNLFPNRTHSSVSSYPPALRLNGMLCRLLASGTDTEVMAHKS